MANLRQITRRVLNLHEQPTNQSLNANELEIRKDISRTDNIIGTTLTVVMAAAGAYEARKDPLLAAAIETYSSLLAVRTINGVRQLRQLRRGRTAKEIIDRVNPFEDINSAGSMLLTSAIRTMVGEARSEGSGVNTQDNVYVAILLKNNELEEAARALVSGTASAVGGSLREPTLGSVIAHLKRLKSKRGINLDSSDETGKSFIGYVVDLMNERPAFVAAHGWQEFTVEGLGSIVRS